MTILSNDPVFAQEKIIQFIKLVDSTVTHCKETIHHTQGANERLQALLALDCDASEIVSPTMRNTARLLRREQNSMAQLFVNAMALAKLAQAEFSHTEYPSLTMASLDLEVRLEAGKDLLARHAAVLNTFLILSNKKWTDRQRAFIRASDSAGLEAFLMELHSEINAEFDH